MKITNYVTSLSMIYKLFSDIDASDFVINYSIYFSQLKLFDWAVS